MDKTPDFLRNDYESKLRSYPKFNINNMYERVFDEMALQQTKRDQLITIHLAAFAFVVPAVLDTQKNISPLIGGCIFLALGFIGFLFSLIIIRYRRYKEAYWICCRTLSVMMTMEEENWTKENIQAIFYQCLKKKVSSSMKKGKLRKLAFSWKNLNSGETLYLVINAIISGGVAGFGAAMVLNVLAYFCETINILAGVLVGAVVFGYTLYQYFKTLVDIYRVCEDQTEKSFNDVFKDAWFLHFFVGNQGGKLPDDTTASQ